jgi:hypothetical protein
MQRGLSTLSLRPGLKPRPRGKAGFGARKSKPVERPEILNYAWMVLVLRLKSGNLYVGSNN